MVLPTISFLLEICLGINIYVRENRRDTQVSTIQRLGQHWEQDTKRNIKCKITFIAISNLF